jgi:hypothetical protein
MQYLKPRGEFYHLLSLNVLQAINSSNTISNAEYTTSFFQVLLQKDR